MSALYNFIKEILSHAKWQKTEADKLANKVKSPCLQYPEDHQKRRRKCPSGFYH